MNKSRSQSSLENVSLLQLNSPLFYKVTFHFEEHDEFETIFCDIL